MSERDEVDIEKLHKAVLRERPEPTEGDEPIPMVMKLGFLLLIAWCGWYLGRYDAHFEPNRSDMEEIAGAPAPAAGGDAEEAQGGAEAQLALGQQLYTGRCSACHQATGQGLTGLAPPLAGSEWVVGDPTTTVRIVLQGLMGPITVKGVEWNGAMPPWGASMSDEEIAAVVSFIRSGWENEAGPVSAEEVKAIRDADTRSTPWTAAEL